MCVGNYLSNLFGLSYSTALLTYPEMHLDWRPIYGHLWCNAVSDQCLHWKYFTFATDSQAETPLIIEKHLYFVKLIMRMVSYIWKIFWPMTPCQECQEEAEFSIIEEAVNIFWWSYFIINCTWANYPGNPCLIQTQCSREAWYHPKLLIDQWAVTNRRIAN